MARYIDLDKAIQDVESVGAYYSEEETVKELCLLEIKGQPIADVVPRSEVERWKANCEQLYKEMSERIIEERKIERKLAKRAVAREIFEEIEQKCLFEEIVGCSEAKLLDEEAYAELKKKYQ